ncbi:prenyltransferase/squalene oxidase repeat-containing protein [Sulfoacidibacillus ferrooxidans]|uniref:Sporulenol synthase n=1 Tax=Sulfoacidibacillus ferrooxidans TaxID=2005001 RepID=A0A9X1V7I9_9BACL|nr:prenyltransferase/squalene oxidase repeat-containing protein [Sulfoacidibacillus ferrooxidans]MCI0183121.1 Sporulenol synthase [Sulfoacidibacillus ferrooxidans]
MIQGVMQSCLQPQVERNDELIEPLLRIDETIARAQTQLIHAQQTDGAWHECFELGVMPDAQTLISLVLLGVEDAKWKGKLLQRIWSTRREDGSWGAYPTATGDVSTTVECYYALSLCGEWAHQDEKKQMTENFILSNGGLEQCRNLTKVFLAIGGEWSWDDLPMGGLYLLLFHPNMPVTIYDIAMFTRVHVAPMVILSVRRYQVVQNPSLLSHLTISKKHKKKRQVFLQRINHSRFMGALIKRCEVFMNAQVGVDGMVMGYHSSTWLWLFARLALGEKRHDTLFTQTLHSMRRQLYEDPQTHFIHQQTCDSHIWNTALAAEVLEQGMFFKAIENQPVLKARAFLAKTQHQMFGDWFRNNKMHPGGFGFSANNSMHPDNDDTVACLSVLATAGPLYQAEWERGVAWLLGMQNRDGGWSAFDRNTGKRWLEYMPANDMQRAIADPSTTDLTSRVIKLLLSHKVVELDDERVLKAIRWLLHHQEQDGSFYGRWGSTYLYGTWCAMQALRFVPTDHSMKALMRAAYFLLSVQQPDGGFGEDCVSDVVGRYVAAASQASQTAWGMDALLQFYSVIPEQEVSIRSEVSKAIIRATTWLIEHADDGVWEDCLPNGSAFPGSLYIKYHIYPKVWPLLALIHFKQSSLGNA